MLSFLSAVLCKISPVDLAKLDPFPNLDSFNQFREKQLEASQEISLAEKIIVFLSRKTGLLDSSSEELQSLQKCLQELQFEIECMLKEGEPASLVLLLLHIVFDGNRIW